MRISILCSNFKHPIFPFLQDWMDSIDDNYYVELVNFKRKLNGGDILFLISCNEIIEKEIRNKYKRTLVIHASDLPRGRGWSPHIWQILQGKNTILVTLLEAEDKIDSGAIWAQKKLKLAGHELYEEINEKLFRIELELMSFALDQFEHINPKHQKEENVTYFPKRSPDDSRLNPNKTIAEQFDLLRVADPDRFPAFFDFRNFQYQITIKKIRQLGV